MTLQEATDQLIEALNNEGPVPSHHRWMLNKHRQEWPRLWRAIDLIVEAKNENLRD